MLPTLRELGIGLVPYAPCWDTVFTGDIRTLDGLDAADWRRPTRPLASNLTRNLRIVDQACEVADEVGATPAQVAWPGCSRKRRRHRAHSGDETHRPPQGVSAPPTAPTHRARSPA